MRNWLGNRSALEQHYGTTGQVPAIRILTPDKVYVVIADDTYNPKNTKNLERYLMQEQSYALHILQVLLSGQQYLHL